MEEKQEKQKLKESGVNNLYYGGILFLFRKNLGEKYLKWVMAYTCLMGEGPQRKSEGVSRGLLCVLCILSPADTWEMFSRGRIEILDCCRLRFGNPFHVARLTLCAS